MTYKLTKGCLSEMLEYGRQLLPNEACGIVASGDGLTIDIFIPIHNIAQDPQVSFQFDPAEWIQALYRLEKNEQQLVGYVHTHPSEMAVPSNDDIRGFDNSTNLLLGIISYKQKDSPQMNWYQPSISNHFISYPLMLT